MKAVIIGSGGIADYERVRKLLEQLIGIGEKPLVICCDGGAYHARKLGFTPDAIVGDMDSIDDETLSFFAEKGVEIDKYPTMKDVSDMEIGLDTAVKKGADRLYLIGATGDRLDHSLSNIGLLYKCIEKGLPVWIVDDTRRTTLISDKISIKETNGQTLSLLPFTQEVTGITTKGLLYPLVGEKLEWSSTRGISNVFEGETAEISIESGLLLVILVDII